MALLAHMSFFVLFDWLCAAVLMSWIAGLVSLAPVRDLVTASVPAAAPAMWLVPALLLLTVPIPGVIALGLAIIVVSACALVLRSAPRQLAEGIVAAVGITPAVLGTVAVQLGICAMWLDFALAAAILCGCGAAIWTLSAIATGAAQPSNKRRSGATAILTAVAATLLSAGAFLMAAESKEEETLFQTTQSLLARLAYAEKPGRPQDTKVISPKRASVPLTSKSGVPGVIPRPDTKADGQHIFLATGHNPFPLARNLTFPFTGEYHLFLAGSSTFPPDAIVHQGTPLDERYLLNAGGIMETEAYQPLNPPLDFRDCAKVLLGISSGERTPASASLHLVTAGLDIDLGNEIFALDPAAKEVLEFRVPASTHSVMVRAIRVLFRRNPMQQDESTKVKIEQFTLTPVLR